MCRASRRWLTNLKITDGTPSPTDEELEQEFENKLLENMINDPAWKTYMKQTDQEIIEGLLGNEQ